MDYLDILIFDWRIFGQPGRFDKMIDLRNNNDLKANVELEVADKFAGATNIADHALPGDQFDFGFGL